MNVEQALWMTKVDALVDSAHERFEQFDYDDLLSRRNELAIMQAHIEELLKTFPRE